MFEGKKLNKMYENPLQSIYFIKTAVISYPSFLSVNLKHSLPNGLGILTQIRFGVNDMNLHNFSLNLGSNSIHCAPSNGGFKDN